MKEEQRIKNLFPPERAVDAVLDTDAYNEIDDQFALSLFCLCPERINVKGLCAAPFANARSGGDPAVGMEKSFDEIKKLLGIMKKDAPVFRGSKRFLPDENTPVKSDAADFLARLCLEYSPDQPLYVVAIGAITDVASAILLEPAFRENCVVVWLGGNAHDPVFRGADEFNMRQDIAAARVVFSCGVPVVQLPCLGVVDSFYTTKFELEHFLKGKNPLCDYLVSETVSYCGMDDEKVRSKVIWDVTAVAWLLNDGERFMKQRVVGAPIPQNDLSYSFPYPSHDMAYVYRIRRDRLYGFLFEKLTSL
ncbi:MAG: nucleoside hydrolase [Clostridia bacterium]|nr:nucleoside hydrolase [Clostridia bacterium]